MRRTPSATASTRSLAEREGRLKEQLYRVLAELGAEWLGRGLGARLVFDVGCGRGLSVLYGWSSSLKRPGLEAELVLVDWDVEALREAGRRAKAEAPGLSVHLVAADASRLPFREPIEEGWLGFYGSVLHELRSQGRLSEALEEASRCFKAVLGYDYVDPDPERVRKLSSPLANPAVKERAEQLAVLGPVDSLTVVLEAVYQLTHPRGLSEAHLHFNASLSELFTELKAYGFEVKWFRLLDLDEEAALRFEALRLEPPRGLKGRAAWLAEAQRSEKSF